MRLMLRQLLHVGIRVRLTRAVSGTSTIFSLSSGHGKCGVSVIRVSGPGTKQALKAVVGTGFEPKERVAYLRTLHHPITKDIIDRGLVLWFPGPASFTGEDLCEFQVHGSLAVISAMLDALGSVSGLRSALPGEFTKRSFYGGKMDLTQVEGLADLIHAETEAQRKQAYLQSSGVLASIYNKWRKQLIHCAAHLEAYIDFSEDENIEDDVVLQLKDELQHLIVEIQEHLNDQRKGEMLRNGVQTAIIGAPNVGKSSFLNLLCQRRLSIVTPFAGTTRDIVESTQNFGGYPVVFSDTAGLRSNVTDAVEQEGIARAKECAEKADVILIVIDAKLLADKCIFSNDSFKKYTYNYLQELGISPQSIEKQKVQWIVNKIDLLFSTELDAIKNISGIFLISCKYNSNLKIFLDSFEALLRSICGSPTSECPRITHERYRHQLQQCVEYLKTFLEEYTPDIYPDLAIAALKLRQAVKCIERITGHVSTDDVLDVIFSDFCIGK